MVHITNYQLLIKRVLLAVAQRSSQHLCMLVHLSSPLAEINDENARVEEDHSLNGHREMFRLEDQDEEDQGEEE